MQDQSRCGRPRVWRVYVEKGRGHVAAIQQSIQLCTLRNLLLGNGSMIKGSMGEMRVTEGIKGISAISLGVEVFLLPVSDTYLYYSISAPSVWVLWFCTMRHYFEFFWFGDLLSIYTKQGKLLNPNMGIQNPVTNPIYFFKETTAQKQGIRQVLKSENYVP